MSDPEVLTDANFMLYAAKHYDNPSCYDMEEFNDDLKRIIYVRRLLTRYKETGDLNERRALNHIIIMGNVFGVEAAVKMLMFKMSDMAKYLNSFLVFLNYIQYKPTVDLDKKLLARLKRI